MCTENDKFYVLIEKETPQKQSISIREAARMQGITRQAVYTAIKKNKLRARKQTTRWEIDVKDLQQYKQDKYSRAKSTYNGELIFDNEKGYYSINQIAQKIGVPAQKIYYATRTGLLPASRKGKAWVVHIDEVRKYQAQYLGAASETQAM